MMEHKYTGRARFDCSAEKPRGVWVYREFDGRLVRMFGESGRVFWEWRGVVEQEPRGPYPTTKDALAAARAEFETPRGEGESK